MNSASREDQVPLMLWTSRSRDELVLQLEQLRQLGLETLPEALITDAGAAVGGAWKGRRHSLYNLLWQGALQCVHVDVSCLGKVFAALPDSGGSNDLKEIQSIMRCLVWCVVCVMGEVSCLPFQ